MKRALLVGIDDYPGEVMDLLYAEKDLERWTSILIDRFGFTRENIERLENSQATKDSVIHKLKWLKKDVSSGDTIVFYFTGHGTTFTERDYDDHPDEPKDEGLCLAGIDLLIDDELNNIFSNISREVNVTVICDSCYSGGMGNHNKYLPRLPDVAFRSHPGSETRRFGDRLTPTSLLIAACEEEKQAFQGTPATFGRSIFSYYAAEVILSSDENLTAKKFIDRLKNKISDADHSQVPQLKGRQDLFDWPLFKGL